MREEGQGAGPPGRSQTGTWHCALEHRAASEGLIQQAGPIHTLRWASPCWNRSRVPRPTLQGLAVPGAERGRRRDPAKPSHTTRYSQRYTARHTLEEKL